MAKFAALNQDYKIVQLSFQKLSEISSTTHVGDGAEIERLKTVYSVQVNKLEVEVKMLKQELAKKSQECNEMKRDHELMRKLENRCD